MVKHWITVGWKINSKLLNDGELWRQKVFLNKHRRLVCARDRNEFASGARCWQYSTLGITFPSELRLIAGTMSCFRWTYDRFWLLHVLFSAGFPIHSLDSAFSRTRSLDTYPLSQFDWKVIYVMSLSKFPSLGFIDRRHNRCYNHFYGACRSLRNFRSTSRLCLHTWDRMVGWELI